MTTASLTDTFVLTEHQLKIRRKEIRKMLRDTFELEHGALVSTSSVKIPCVLRAYKMTEAEYQANKAHVVTALLNHLPAGDAEQEERPCEGFFYDFRQLLQEGWIGLDKRVLYLPILLSVNRWNVLNAKYGIDMHNYSTRQGILQYPLLYDELLVMLSNLQSPMEDEVHPVVCFLTDESREHEMFTGIVKKGCRISSLTAIQELFQRVWILYDRSELDRYGPPEVAASTEQKRRREVTTMHDVKPQYTAKIDRILARVQSELESIHEGPVQSIHNLLYTENMRQYVQQELQAGLTEAQIQSILVSDWLSSVFHQRAAESTPMTGMMQS